MTTSCARSHLAAHSRQVYPDFVNVHREAVGAVAATAI